MLFILELSFKEVLKLMLIQVCLIVLLLHLIIQLYTMEPVLNYVESIIASYQSRLKLPLHYYLNLTYYLL